jgi:hypothetical protein
MSDERSYVVVPFERHGTAIGARRIFEFEGMQQARTLARQIAQHVPGVAVIERDYDAETGDSIDRLIEAAGVLPYGFPGRSDWSTRLH